MFSLLDLVNPCFPFELLIPLWPVVHKNNSLQVFLLVLLAILALPALQALETKPQILTSSQHLGPLLIWAPKRKRQATICRSKAEVERSCTYHSNSAIIFSRTVRRAAKRMGGR